MRIVLRAPAVEVRTIFAGDLLRVTEISRAGQEFRVGLSATADLPLPMPLSTLVRVAGDQLELQVPAGMRVRAGDRIISDGDCVDANVTATVRWKDVEIAIVPTMPAGSRPLTPRRAWPLELLSSTTASVLALATVFPAMALLLIVDRLDSRDQVDFYPAHIVFTHRQPLEATPRPAPPKPRRDDARRDDAHPDEPAQTRRQQATQAQTSAGAVATLGSAATASGGAAAASGGAAAASGGAVAASGGAPAGTQASEDKGAVTDSVGVRAAARDAAAHSGILGLFDGQVRFLGARSDAGDGNRGSDGSNNGDSNSSSAGSSNNGGGNNNNGGGNSAGSGNHNGGSGSLSGQDIGEAYGVGGLGLVGSGVGGGGGTDDETIGLGSLGTMGHGDGTGSGYGCGAGGLGGRRAEVPDVVAGSAQVRGALDKEAIRRVIRRHLNEVRFCYERALQNAPTLAGRVMVEFVIEPDGSVRASAARQSTVDPAVAACTAGAFLRWQFPSVRDGGQVWVHYPFDFVPAGL